MPKTLPQKASSNSPLKDLVLLFSIPIAIITIAAAVIYVPRLMANPAHDFIYSVCEEYSCKNRYAVDSAGYITETPPESSEVRYGDGPVQLRYYDVSAEATHSLTLDEARRYRLDTSSKSPDGYTLIRESSGGNFLFWGGRDTGWYLRDGAKKKKIELSPNESYYSQNIEFLGWVK